MSMTEEATKKPRNCGRKGRNVNYQKEIDQQHPLPASWTTFEQAMQAYAKGCQPPMHLPPRRSKYGAVATRVDGIRFASKKEAAYYDTLKLLQKAGEIDFFLMQVPFSLPGGVRYLADFVTFNGDCGGGNLATSYSIRVIDCKGFKTPEYRLKKKQIKALYEIEIEEV
jgi:hypothetical protein